jgi:glycosyltransferase involved in cell wall biosynthesis
MHVLALSYLYPSPRFPTSGVFVERQVRELARLVAVDVVSPVPWVPGALRALSARWRAYAEQPATTRCHGVAVHHPRYLQPAGAWSVALAGVTMAAGARPVASRLTTTAGADVIHAHRLLPDGLAAALLGRRLGRPVVCTLRGTDVHVATTGGVAVRAAARFVARTCRAVTAVNGALLEALARVAVLPRSARVIPNGVDAELFRPHVRELARRQLGLSEEAPLVLYVGSLVASKGLDVLLPAFAAAARRTPHATLVLVGASVQRADLAGDVRARADALGVGEQVRVVVRRAHDEMPLWLSAADVLALASRREGFPNVVREAIACGTPCVVTALPGMDEVVDPDCGIVVPMEDAGAFGDALDEALWRPWDRAQIRRRALAWRWDESAAALLDVLAGVAGRRAREVA